MILQPELFGGEALFRTFQEEEPWPSTNQQATTRARARCASAPSSKPRRWARSTGPSAARRSVSSWTRRTRESSRACARRDELALNCYRLNHEFALHIFRSYALIRKVLQLFGFNALARLLRPCARASRLLGRPSVGRGPGGLAPFALAVGFDTPAQRIHEVDDLRRLAARRLDLLAGLLLLQEILQRLFVAVLEPLRLEVSLLGLHDMLRQVEHILRDLLVGNIVEILLLLPHFVGIAQRHAEHALAARFERDDMLA